MTDQSVEAFTARRRERAQLHRNRAQERATPKADLTRRSTVRKGKRILSLGALAVAAATALAGCGLSGGLYNLPLPGGADLGGSPLTFHVRMANVYDLVPQASVKIDDVTVGKVSSIDLANGGKGTWAADVTVEVNRAQSKLPANSTAELRQTSLLGEKYVELLRPQKPATQQISDNATVNENPGYTHVEIEQVLGALSLLLNDGGLPQIHTISHELNTALSGHEGDVKSLLNNVNTLAGNLNAHSADITKALDGLNQLSATLDKQKDQLARAVDNLGPGLKVLTDQRGQLVDMLKALQNLSGVAVDTVNKTQADLIADLQALEPSLQKLAQSGDAIANSLPLLATVPFSDYAAGSFSGDYANLYANLDLNVGTLLQNLGRSRQNFIGQLGVLPPQLGGLVGSTNGDQPGQPDAGTASGSQAGQQQQQQQQQPQVQQQNPPSSPSQGGSSGMGGIFGTLMGGGS